MNFKPMNPDYQSHVRDAFERQPFLYTIDARLATIEPGHVVIVMPFRKDLTQQDGFLHAGIVTTLIDTACGLSALTLMPSAARVLAVEIKVNFMSPAVGDTVEAVGTTLKSGRTISVCTGTVYAVTEETRKPVACMQATMMAML